MADEKLLNRLAKFGFQMFETVDDVDVTETLAEVVRSHDSRLWEGFPVMLAKAAEDYSFSLDSLAQKLNNQRQKEDFQFLMVVSLAAYNTYNLTFSWARKYWKTLSEDNRKAVSFWRNVLVHGAEVRLGETALDPDRMRETFELYFAQAGEETKRKREKLDEYSLEYSLSQVFSPKQRDLFKKKLEGKPFTKTDQEYYSRTVKKKVVALANSELHALARKLLEQ
jgi:hypothetical protein